jgi:hypothetical protein
MVTVADDPREVLKAVGVECAEVDGFIARYGECTIGREYSSDEGIVAADDTILALARIVAKYKWERDRAVDDLAGKGEVLNAIHGHNTFPKDYGEIVFDLDRRWKEHDA